VLYSPVEFVCGVLDVFCVVDIVVGVRDEDIEIVGCVDEERRDVKGDEIDDDDDVGVVVVSSNGTDDGGGDGGRGNSKISTTFENPLTSP
jgi:hypothetical protein